MEKNIKVPVKNEDLTDLKIVDVITLTGNIITARDQAHKRILEQGAPLDIEGAAIFHAGPIISEDENGYKMVAVGPTTSMRMNPYQSDVLDLGAKIVIGKGGMDDTVREALVRNKYTGEEFKIDFNKCENIPYSEDWFRFKGDLNSKSSVMEKM